MATDKQQGIADEVVDQLLVGRDLGTALEQHSTEQNRSPREGRDT
jgi:hypothetical protein